MTIEKIYYQRNFRIGEFLYENIGIGIQVNEGEDALQALDEAKRLCHEYHNQNIRDELKHQNEENLPVIRYD